MELNLLDGITIFGYFVVLMFFGLAVRRIRDFSDYSVARRQVPASMIFASLAATYIGPGFSVGLTGKAFSTGYVFYFLPLFFVIQTIIVGRYLARRLHAFSNCHTIGDVIGERYGRPSQILAGIVSVGLCIGFAAIMAKVGGVILSSVTGLPLVIAIAIITSVGVLYTFTGGLKSVIATEAFQFSIFTIVFPLVLFFCMSQPGFSLSEAGDKALTLTSQGFASLTAAQIVAIAVSFLLGETLIPPYANRVLASKSGEVAARGFVVAGLFGTIWLGIVIALGIAGAVLLPAETGGDEVFSSMVLTYVPHGLIGIVFVALIAIVMSSQESVLNAGAVAFTRDLVNMFGKMSDRSSLLLTRLFTLVAGVLATIFAVFAPSIIDGLLIMYSIWAPAIIIPLVAALYLRTTKPAAGFLSILAGGGGSLVWRLVLDEPLGVPSVLIGLAAALGAYVIGHRLGGEIASQEKTSL